MKLIHGTWIPKISDTFIQSGSFYIWVESTETQSKKPTKNEHPFTLKDKNLTDFLTNLKIISTNHFKFEKKYFVLPSNEGKVIKSYELFPFIDEEIPETFTFERFQIECFEITLSALTKILNEIHFYCLYNSGEFMLGADLLFWYHYTQTFKEIIKKDQYIPYLKYVELDKKSNFKIYPYWQIVSEKYDQIIERYKDYIPELCVSGFEEEKGKIEFYKKETLLRHFSENLLQETINSTKFTDKSKKPFENTIFEDFFYFYNYKEISKIAKSTLMDNYKKWFNWKEKIVRSHDNSSFNFCFKLKEPNQNNNKWNLIFLVESKKDPSLKIVLDDYWHFNEKTKKLTTKTFGSDLEKNMLLDLGYSAKIYPKIWESMNTDKPSSLDLTTEEAFEFLKEKAVVMESSGFKIILPAWWTPEGRKKAKIKLKASSSSKTSSKASSKSFFSAESLINYEYKLSIGDIELSEKEWKELVNSKTPLINFRGEWIELDIDKMKEILELWQKSQNDNTQLTIEELLKMASHEDRFEIDYDKNLAEMMDKFKDKSKFELVEDPKKLKASLREYQKRGVSWIEYLENIGLNPCLADDMGLGKTIQIIARLLREREGKKQTVGTTLLIAPTSVVGNWQHEVNKFAPTLKTLLHHGSKRIKDKNEFLEMISKNDIIITSYSLIKRDEAFFKAMEWHRIVIDEAQNIKNPKADQTKVLLQLKSKHKIALTGTPVENRLLDLWSIFNFLNPGYLGTQASFRKTFEIPIQKENEVNQSKILKNLIEPFILRRLKTDKNIIKDLPDKIEQKVYCNLTKEQGSLYEAVVKEISLSIDSFEGIKRKGLIVSSLMKLKQICNHPVQFLQDKSEFSKIRSHKLSRLSEMISEVLESGESILIFSQFKEVCIELDKFIKHHHHYRTHLLHGDTNRTKRQEMIEEFQHPDSEPSVFILSLKAGGVGITLTKANHVFHFDRWWNPAVEEQATDRAFRIGQSKNVFVHKFVAIGTLEEKIDQMLEGKKKLSGSILASDESWLTELDNEAFKKLIHLSKDAVLTE